MPSQPGYDPPPTTLAARVVITLGVPFAVWLVTGDRTPLEFPFREVLGGWYSLGLTPVVYAFVVVELMAAAVPRFRSRRIAGPADRARLTRVAWILAGIFTAWDVLATIIELEGGLSRVTGSTVWFMTLNVGWTLTLVGMAQLVSRSGLVNGYALLLAFAWLPSSFVSESPYGPLLAVAALAGLVLACGLLLEGRRALQSHGELVLRAPLSGLTPILLAVAILSPPAGRWGMLVRYLPGERLVEFDANPPARLVAMVALVGVFAALLARLFNPHASISSLVPNIDPSVVFEREGAARSHTLLFCVGLTLATTVVEFSVYLPLTAALVATSCLAALLLDAREEYVARRQLGELVPVWLEQRAYALGPLSAALTRANIPHHVRSARLHTLLPHVPLVPAELMVPPPHAEAALAVLLARNEGSVAHVRGHAPSTF